MRHNKTAIGMTKTAKRSNHATKESPALFLKVRGTTDILRGLSYLITKKPCPCCGGKDGGKWVLNDRGRRKLKALRSDVNDRINQAIPTIKRGL